MGIKFEKCPRCQNRALIGMMGARTDEENGIIHRSCGNCGYKWTTPL